VPGKFREFWTRRVEMEPGNGNGNGNVTGKSCETCNYKIFTLKYGRDEKLE
jgi:hypothetical protein